VVARNVRTSGHMTSENSVSDADLIAESSAGVALTAGLLH